LKTWARAGEEPDRKPDSGLAFNAIVDFLKKNNVILPLGAWLPGRARVLFGLGWDVFERSKSLQDVE